MKEVRNLTSLLTLMSGNLLDEISTILYRVNKVIRENYEKYQ